MCVVCVCVCVSDIFATHDNAGFKSEFWFKSVVLLVLWAPLLLSKLKEIHLS